MIKVFDQSRQLILQTDNYTRPILEIDATAFDVLSLFVPADMPVNEEDYVVVEEGRFVVKEKNFTKGQYELVCLADVDDLELAILPNFAHVTMTMQEMLDEFLAGTGWIGTCASPMKRTVTGTNLTPLQAVLKAVDTFKFEARFDTINKTVTVAEVLGHDIGAYFDDELNLQTLEYQSDSYEYATRIVPTGFGGVGIESVNDGFPYLENKSYYKKTKTLYWPDERYTVLENLKYDAQKKLDALAVPLRSYAVELIDLSKDRPELTANVFDTIWIKHKDSNTRIQQRIVKKTIPLDRPWDAQVIIANKMRDLLTEEEKALNTVRRSYESVTARLELFQDAIESEVNLIKVDVDDTKHVLNHQSSILQQHADSIIQMITNEILQSFLDQTTQDIMLNFMTQLTQTSENWEFLTTQIRTNLEDQIGDTNAAINTLTEWVRIEGAKLILGRSDSELALSVRNDRIYFEQGGQEVAYFSDSKLFVYDIEAINSHVIGNFKWVPRANGNLSLI